MSDQISTALREHFITTDRPFTEGAVEAFTQKIHVSGALVRATLAITALGLYEAEIDGRKVGDRLFTPGFTYYPTHLYYQQYDVTDMLCDGSDLVVYLAQGWYCGRFTFENKTQIYGERPALSWILTLEDAGGVHTYLSDGENVTQVASGYAYAGFYDGEICGNGLGDALYPPKKYLGELPSLIEESTVSVRIRKRMPVRSVNVIGERTIVDFGQNFAGIVTIDPEKMSGEHIKLRHAEILNPDGTLYTANLRRARAETVYTRGRGIYRPRFTYMGFRYVEITGCDYTDGLIEAYSIYSDMERTGYFECERYDVDRLYQNQLWGQMSNYIEVPTDCPQRDERMGYTGDGHVFALTGAYNFDTEAFWAKFLKDIKYSQEMNTEGYVPPTVPAPPGKQGIGFMSMLGWGNCICIVPDMLHRHFGTDRYLREYYPCMKKFVDCELRRTGGFLGRRDLWISPSLGDWLAMGRDVKYMAMHNGPVSNAFIVNDLEIMVRSARLLGYEADAEYYSGRLERTRNAYIRAFIKKNGEMRDDYQGAYVMALAYVLKRDDPLYKMTYSALVSRIGRDGMQTGFFATEHILPLLCENGDEGLAFDLLLDSRVGGWMYQVGAGATTTWERWDALRPDGSVNESKMSGDNMVSFNHYSFGSVGRFYYEYILGITPIEHGFRSVRIAPRLDSRIGRFSGGYRDISVSFDGESLRIITPVAAQIVLPSGEEHSVEAGEYTYKIKNTGGHYVRS